MGTVEMLSWKEAADWTSIDHEHARAEEDTWGLATWSMTGSAQSRKIEDIHSVVGAESFRLAQLIEN